MELLIFKTNIETLQEVKVINQLFNTHQSIADWWVDIEDIDRVMRIELSGLLAEKEVVKLMHTLGFECNPLMD